MRRAAPAAAARLRRDCALHASYPACALVPPTHRVRLTLSACRLLVLFGGWQAGWDGFVDEVWVVAAPHASVVSRLAERNGLNAEAAEARVAAQMSTEARIARCHVPLSSAFGESASRDQLAAALGDARARAARMLPSCDAHSPAGRFHALCENAGVSARVQHRWWGTLRDAYCASGLAYHNMVHIDAMLTLVDTWRASGQLANADLVAFSVFFHDAVYNPRAKDNEARSADMWRAFCADAANSCFSPADVDTVAAYIERTARHHDGPASGDLGHFLDADLAILGRPPPEYAEYARAVRLEYAHVPSREFATKRSAFLAHMASAPTIYFGPLADLDGRARSNLTEEIQRLERRPSAQQ